MKKIYTSNYARCSTNPNAWGISASVPDWYTGKRLPLLAPTWELLNDYKKSLITPEQYGERYLDILEKRGITPSDLLEALPENSILLCYEPPGHFCHRRILAEWIEKHTGNPVPEWISEKEQKRHEFVDSLLQF